MESANEHQVRARGVSTVHQTGGAVHPVTAGEPPVQRLTMENGVPINAARMSHTMVTSSMT